MPEYPMPELYLNEEEVAVVKAFSDEMKPFIEKYGLGNSVDLVVEGGVGSGITVPHIVRSLFDHALYVGTDLVVNSPRMSSAIDTETLGKLISVNEHPSLEMEGSVINANCFDTELISDIKAKTDTHNAMLVSFNALYALADRKANPWVTKEYEDAITLQNIVGATSPYAAQLHLSNMDIWSDTPNAVTLPFHTLERLSQELGLTTERISNDMFDGLLIVR